LHLEPAWLDEARALGVEDLVEGFGPLDHASALGLLTCVDAFVRPTTADGDAISVREALTLGIPCVASDVSLRPRGTHLFKTGDAAALAAAIERALTEGPLPTDRVDAGPFLLALYRGLGPPLPARSPEGLSNLT
jgi:glycosyltransferase involved in cell wall biosynthesis